MRMHSVAFLHHLVEPVDRLVAPAGSGARSLIQIDQNHCRQVEPGDHLEYLSLSGLIGKLCSTLTAILSQPGSANLHLLSFARVYHFPDRLSVNCNAPALFQMLFH